MPGSSRWQVQLLGGLSVRSGDVVLPRFRDRNDALLFARLVISCAVEHERSDLAEWLWPSVGGDTSTRRSAPRLARLRKALDRINAQFRATGVASAPLFIATHRTLQGNASAFDCDVTRFVELAHAGRWAQARACFRGELLPGHADSGWLDLERERLARLFDWLERQIAGSPVPPGPAPREALLPAPYVSTFVGRERPLQDLLESVSTHRLVQVTGPGGCGKSRLCSHLMRLPGFQASGLPLLAFVRLDGCAAAADLSAHLRAELHLSADPGPSLAADRGGEDRALQQVRLHLASRRGLIVLDGFEHLVGPQADAWINRLFVALPEAHLLITSVRALRRSDIRTLRLGALPLPADDADIDSAPRNPSVALFVDRAHASRADFRLHRRNLPGVIRLCRVLQGMPLALEIAASKVDQITPHELARQVQADAAKLAFSGRRARWAGDRHASIRAVLEWSWGLLEPDARAALATLSVMQGGFTMAQALELTAVDTAAQSLHSPVEPIEPLERLIRDSLIQDRPVLRGASPPGPGGRYQLLDSVRDFAAGMLPEALPHARRRQRRMFLAAAKALADLQAAAHEDDTPNFVAAIDSAVSDGVPAEGIEIALALEHHWATRGASPQALNALVRMTEEVAPPTPGWDALAALLPGLLVKAGRVDAAQALARRAVAASGGDAPRRLDAILALAGVRWLVERDAAATLTSVEPVRREAEATGLLRAAARARLLLGQASWAHLGPAAAATHFAAARTHFSRLEDRRGLLAVQSGEVACLMADPARRTQAIAAARDGLSQATAIGDPALQLQFGDRLAQSLEQGGTAEEIAEALSVCQEQTRLAHALGLEYYLHYALWNQGTKLLALDRPEDAARLMAFSAGYWVSRFAPLSSDEQAELAAFRQRVADRVGPRRARAAWIEGARLGLVQALRIGTG